MDNHVTKSKKYKNSKGKQPAHKRTSLNSNVFPVTLHPTEMGTLMPPPPKVIVTCSDRTSALKLLEKALYDFFKRVENPSWIDSLTMFDALAVSTSPVLIVTTH
jgi:hypothetical protein